MEYHSSILKLEELDHLQIKITHTRCNGCENHCLLTINQFGNGKKYISGNRCEKGAGIVSDNQNLPNLMKYKYERLFHYTPLEEKDAPRGTIGIPRVLNMYEDYPFWFTFLTNLGFRVILSEKSNRATYEKGMESMPSESVCYPAKLSHGHIISLMNKGVKTIFYPCIPYSRNEFEKADTDIFNFFYELLEDGKFTDLNENEFDLNGYLIIFTSNLSENNYKDIIPAPLLSRFTMKALFEPLDYATKNKYVQEKCKKLVNVYNEKYDKSIDFKDVLKNIDKDTIKTIKNIRYLNQIVQNTLISYIENMN